MRYDPGLQPERTALAWRRTSLNIAAGGLVALRALPGILGRPGLAIGIVTTTAGLGLYLAARRRSCDTIRVLLQRRGVLPDGRMLFVISVAVTVVAALCALVLIKEGEL